MKPHVLSVLDFIQTHDSRNRDEYHRWVKSQQLEWEKWIQTDEYLFDVIKTPSLSISPEQYHLEHYNDLLKQFGLQPNDHFKNIDEFRTHMGSSADRHMVNRILLYRHYIIDEYPEE